ncbi:aminotransferase class IV family protein [Gemmobacter serpentinus]|uniref:aminotransferase class IV family protein n=1 Tax=Gemmobacter serpentinus TaxID=2652247 RepID=UPI001CF69D7D|nr:aminotransferase class IV family protein [Gemmobacter serpentinus]
MESALRIRVEPGLKLIETMLWDGAAYPRLALHLARLEASAAVFGFPVSADQVIADLPAPIGPARIRLTLNAEGRIEITQATLPPAVPLWRLGLAGMRLDSADPWLRHKTTQRASYDAARAALPDGLDELIFANERGEVCEGTITNLFFDRGQGLRTPPLSSGLLPGVLRAELAAPEEVLLIADLPKVRLWVGNALRGLIPAVWAG